MDFKQYTAVGVCLLLTTGCEGLGDALTNLQPTAPTPITFAPDSLGGRTLTIQRTGGTCGGASVFSFFFQSWQQVSTLTGWVGSFTYIKSGNTATVSILWANGASQTVSLTFSSATSGTYYASHNAGGSVCTMSANFTLT